MSTLYSTNSKIISFENDDLQFLTSVKDLVSLLQVNASCEGEQRFFPLRFSSFIKTSSTLFSPNNFVDRSLSHQGLDISTSFDFTVVALL